MRPIFRLAAAAALCLASLPALATTQPNRPGAARLQQEAAAACRADCMQQAASRPGGLSMQAAQACTIRCGAGAGYQSQQARAGSAEATGRGRVVQAAPMVTPVAMSVPAQTSGRASHGVLYGSRTPSPAFGMVVGAADRLGAHREAERQCAAGGQGCRVLAEFNAACGAAAQGIRRSQWALFVTSDPNTYVVTSLSGGSGATQQEAERQALAECRSRDPQGNCRIVAAACNTRG